METKVSTSALETHTTKRTKRAKGRRRSRKGKYEQDTTTYPAEGRSTTWEACLLDATKCLHHGNKSNNSIRVFLLHPSTFLSLHPNKLGRAKLIKSD